MTVILVLLLALAGIVAAWAWGEVARQKRRAVAAERLSAKLTKQMKGMQEAYKREADRLEEIWSGSADERFAASLAILRDLSRGPNGAD